MQDEIEYAEELDRAKDERAGCENYASQVILYAIQEEISILTSPPGF